MPPPADIQSSLVDHCILPEVIGESAANRGLATVCEFVHAIDSKDEAKEALFEGGPFVKNLGHVGNVKRAWRDAAEEEEKERCAG